MLTLARHGDCPGVGAATLRDVPQGGHEAVQRLPRFLVLHAGMPEETLEDAQNRVRESEQLAGHSPQDAAGGNREP